MSTTGSAFINSDSSIGEMRTLPLVAVSKTHERLHCHERGQNALMQVKGPSLTNEHSDSGFTKMSEGVTAITARDYVTLQVPRCHTRRTTWCAVENAD